MAGIALACMAGWLFGYLIGRIGRLRSESDLTARALAEARSKELNARLTFATEMRKLVKEWEQLQKSLDMIEGTAKSIDSFRTKLERERALIPERPQEVSDWKAL